MIHDLRSVSKSVVSCIYGIALAQGKVPAPETRLSAAFPQYADLLQQPDRAGLTVGHLLSMTVDMDWDELTIPYGDLRNSENAMEAAPDRYRYVLERPILGPPGVKWSYNGGCTTLLARLIADGTGERLHAYARRVLFEPLGFGENEWVLSEDGNEVAASGLRLLPRDMPKIGQLGADRRRVGRQTGRASRLGEARDDAGSGDTAPRWLRLSLVHRRLPGCGASAAAVDRRHWLGRPAALRDPQGRSRDRHQLRQLPPFRRRPAPGSA